MPLISIFRLGNCLFLFPHIISMAQAPNSKVLVFLILKVCATTIFYQIPEICTKRRCQIERIPDHQELRRLPLVQFLEKPCDIILNIHNYFFCHILSGFLHGNANCRPIHLISPAKLSPFGCPCKFRKKFSGFRGNCYFCAPKIAFTGDRRSHIGLRLYA